LTFSALIVAAGRGLRLGGEIPKQYIPLDGPCALRRSIEAFLAIEAIRWVRVVFHPDDRPLYDEALAGLEDARVLDPVAGGKDRAHSVSLGLESLTDFDPAIVLIHDAARPFVSGKVIEDVISALDVAEGAFAALPLVDALWKTDQGCATSPVARDGLWRAQTPQGFRFRHILNAHRLHDGTGADDVAVAREAGMTVRLVEGSEQNYKITTTADLRRALQDVRALAWGDAAEGES
jgi:2-C-methyl-D-erythritol 4-phosphate cytidylyltransferase